MQECRSPQAPRAHALKEISPLASRTQQLLAASRSVPALRSNRTKRPADLRMNLEVEREKAPPLTQRSLCYPLPKHPLSSAFNVSEQDFFIHRRKANCPRLRRCFSSNKDSHQIISLAGFYTVARNSSETAQTCPGRRSWILTAPTAHVGSCDLEPVR
jgi:hypothetical protein